MPLSTLKDKGQITLPVEIRRKLQAHKGDIFNFEMIGDQVIMTPQKLSPSNKNRGKTKEKAVDITKYIGSMRGQFGEIEEIDAYICKQRKSWD